MNQLNTHVSENVHHRPILDVDKVCKHYTKKDGVPATYVCTTALGSEAQAMDVFYRESPHPQFGNRYFGLYWSETVSDEPRLMITNADKIEQLEFDMVQDEQGTCHYSRHRHDYNSIDGIAIDGGRAYARIIGDLDSAIRRILVVRNGLFYHKDES